MSAPERRPQVGWEGRVRSIKGGFRRSARRCYLLGFIATALTAVRVERGGRRRGRGQTAQPAAPEMGARSGPGAKDTGRGRWGIGRTGARRAE